MSRPSFSARLVRWQSEAGRNDLPWQNTRDAYRIWLSEIMLQQTQVATVVPYYARFLARFPDVGALAVAPQDDVLALWAGLGYYSRARNLHRAAKDVVARFDGRFPDTRAGLETLPGVGRTTAAAIAAFAFGRREAILDGNVKRVLARHFAIAGDTAAKDLERAYWARAEAALPESGIERYTQAIMDLGATVCTARRPRCEACPVAATCAARALDAIERFPAKRSRPAVPHRTTTMLLLFAGDEVLVVKRPPTGIWGGLWCFPERAGDEDLAAICARFGCSPSGPEVPLATVAHGFTHFTLDIAPVRVAVTRGARLAEPGAAWLVPQALREAAIPAPVNRILAALDAEATSIRGGRARPDTGAGSPGAPSRRRARAASASRARGSAGSR